MLKIGIIVNPIAGLGGAAGLKGSDGDAAKIAAEMGYVSPVHDRVMTVLTMISQHKDKVSIATCGGLMGSLLCDEAGLEYKNVYTSPNKVTSASDTKHGVEALRREGIDLLLFAGGDGTARDVTSIIGAELLALGIPSGVKMHSGVFAISPEAAAELLLMLINHDLVATTISQVRDLDEEALRAGKVAARFYGEMLTPAENRYLQHVKCGGKESEPLVLEEISADVIESFEEGVLYILGSGSTTKAIKDAVGIDGTLLGVDVVLNSEAIATDIDEHGLYELVQGKDCMLIVTTIGGQGHVFGRGNQQLSPRVLDEIGIENIKIVATKEKIKSLEGRPLLCDTGSEELDKRLCGLKQIITGYEDRVAYPMKNP